MGCFAYGCFGSGMGLGAISHNLYNSAAIPEIGVSAARSEPDASRPNPLPGTAQVASAVAQQRAPKSVRRLVDTCFESHPRAEYCGIFTENTAPCLYEMNSLAGQNSPGYALATSYSLGPWIWLNSAPQFRGQMYGVRQNLSSTRITVYVEITVMFKGGKLELSWIIKKLFRGILKLLFVLLLLVLAVWLVTWYSMRPANQFCDNVLSTDSIENVMTRASEQGYKFFEYKRDDTHVVKIPTQDSPFFRMACVITYSNGQIISKEILADD